jgi:hypothetical protein
VRVLYSTTQPSNEPIQYYTRFLQYFTLCPNRTIAAVAATMTTMIVGTHETPTAIQSLPQTLFATTPLTTTRSPPVAQLNPQPTSSKIHNNNTTG